MLSGRDQLQIKKYKNIWIEIEKKRANVDYRRETKGIANASGKMVLRNNLI